MQSFMMETKKHLIYLGTIFGIWLFAYIVCLFLLPHRLGWDEINYLTVAKGIAEDFDFSSRFFTPMGLVKYPFPQHTHHYPLYASYIALFFKLFGVSINIAYFSSWLSALIACIFIYLTMVLMTKNKSFSFFIGISFLFLPRVISFCDSAMMEITGCALLSVLCFFIFKDLAIKKINLGLYVTAAIFLFFFKSLFIGVLFGLFLLIIIAYTLNIVEMQLSKAFMNVGLLLVLFLVCCWILSKFVFLPLAPMMSFHMKQVQDQTYADFLGGFLNSPLDISLTNLKSLYDNVVHSYFPLFPFAMYQNGDAYYVLTSGWWELGAFLLCLFYIGMALVFFWNSFSPIQKLWMIFSVIAILFFNLIYSLIATSALSLCCRYNMIYLPLMMVSCGIVLEKLFTKHKKAFSILFLGVLIFFYISFYYTQFKFAEWTKDYFSKTAHNNSEMIKRFIGDTKPMFVYFNDGTHTSWDSYPTKVIVLEFTNKLLKQVNSKLPKPISYLFLKPENQLYRDNFKLIVNKEPILDNWYTFYGFDGASNTVVYRLSKSVGVE